MKVNENGEILGLPNIRRWYETPKTVPSCSGDGKAFSFDWNYDEHDKCFVPSKGKDLDLYGMIQLHKDSCDISAIIARVKNGDVSALNVRSGEYMDVTEAPRSLNELADFQARLDGSWNKLDPKIKEVFSNDFDNFRDTLLAGELSKTIDNYIKNNTNKEVPVNE